MHGFRSLFSFYIITFCFSNYIVYNIRVRLLLYHLKDKSELYTYRKELIGILKATEKLFHMLNNQVLFLYFTALKNVTLFSDMKVEHSSAQPCAHLIVHVIPRPTNADATPKKQKPEKVKDSQAFCDWLQGEELVLRQQGVRKDKKREK